jgi:Cu-processing system ATP-binding protein
MTPSIEFVGVSKRYGEHVAVRDVSFALNAGKTVALVGHNGAGKSTLIKLMLGVTSPSFGTVRVLGLNPVSGGSALRRRLGFLPENAAFHPASTGREAMDFFARLKGEPISANMALLERVGLAAAAHRRIGAYSKGMRQRLGLAQALIGAPDILFLDEPTTGLDPGLRRGFYEILGQLRDRGVTVLLSSHALSELQGNADRVLVLNRGSLIADGSLSALRDLAHLPVRISVRAAHSLAELGPDWQKLGEGCAARLCEFGDKLTVLKTLLPQLDPADTLEIDEPSLDDLYAHFLGEEAGQ